VTLLKIERSTEGDAVVFTLSGRIRAERVAELQNLCESATAAEGCRIVLDLREVDLVDRDAVRFLAGCVAAGIELAHCPGYVREWIAREADEQERRRG
jgi:anti-anti-sigma regulatory factor